MLVDESALSEGCQAYDIVVVGAGVAGLTLARAFVGQRKRVLVVEAGGGGTTREGRADYAGEIAEASAHPQTDLYRVRALGGTSRIWGGRCIPYDPIDFEARDWVPHSGWPIAYREVSRYYRGALHAAEAGGAVDDPFDPRAVLADRPRELVSGLDGDLVATTLERFSRPTNFWTRYGAILRQAGNVDVLPCAAVTGIGLDASGRAVESLEIVARSGRRCRLRVGTCVLAAGGLETTRLLLASRDFSPTGIGNAHDQLGRYYMSHLCTTAAVLVPAASRPVANDYVCDRDGVYMRRRLWLTDHAQRTHRLQNTTFRCHMPEPADPRHGDAILSAMFLTKVMVQKEYAAKFVETPVGASAYVRHAGNIMRHPVRLSRFARMWLHERVLAKRKLPSVIFDPGRTGHVLEFHAEQAPNPLSRVSLSTNRDRYGVPRLHVDWRSTSDDIDSLRRAHDVLERALIETGSGVLKVDREAIQDRVQRFGIAGGHHIGTTRMSQSPASGVVDKNCRVHGVENLYVASASVLPTSGQANPTLTLLALTLRLADHLGARSSRHEPALEDANA